MYLSSRPALAILAMVALGVTLGVSLGYYHPGTLVGFVVALACSLAACVSRDRALSWPQRWGRRFLLFSMLFLSGFGFFLAVDFSGIESHGGTHMGSSIGMAVTVASIAFVLSLGVLTNRVGPAKPVEAVLLAAALLLAGNGIFWDRVFYGEWPPGQTMIHIGVWVGFAAILILLIPGSFTSRRSLAALMIVLFSAGALLRVGALWAAPDPVIDVFTWLRDAPAQLLHGHNPYSAEYESPYETERAREYGVPTEAEKQPAAYPPLPILLTLPLSAIGQDVRYANVACDLLAALVLYLAAACRGQPRIGVLVCACYLFLPRTPYMMEQAWFEPMLAASLGTGLFLVERGRKIGYVLLGLGLTGKQFGVAMLFPLARNLWGHWRWLLLGVVIAALTMVPFFLWDRASFLDVILFKHLGRKPVTDSMTFTSAVFHLSHGYLLPRAGTWLLAIALIAWITWRTPVGQPGAALWMGTALYVFCLCHTQAHFNYYYLCQYLWLLGIATLLSSNDAGK